MSDHLGESGAAPFSALAAMMTMDRIQRFKEMTFGLDENSKVLLFSTEGDTDLIVTKTLYEKALINNYKTGNTC